MAAADTASTTATATITFNAGPTITGLAATGTSAPGTDYTDAFTVAPTDATVSATGTGCSLTGSTGSYTLTASRADEGTRTCTITATANSIDTTATATITFGNAPTITGLEATGTSAPGTDYTDDFTLAPTTSTVLVSGEGCSLSGTAGSYTLTASRPDAGTRTCSVAAVDTLSTTADITITFGNAPTISGLEATGTSAPGTDYTDDFTVAPTTSTVLVSGEGCSLSGTSGSYTLTVSRADAGTRSCSVAAVDTLSTNATATITFGTAPTITGLEATGTSAPGTDFTDDFTVAPTTSTVLVSGTGCSLSGTAGSYSLAVSRADEGTRTCTVTATADSIDTTATATITFGNAPTITGLEAIGTSAPGTDFTDDFTVAPTTSTVLVSGAGCALSGTAGSYTLTVSRADAGTRTCSVAAVDTLSTNADVTITFGTAPTITGLEAIGTSAPGTDFTDDFTVAPTTSTVLVSGAGCALSGTAGSYTLTVSRADAGTRTCSVAAVDSLSTTADVTITFGTAPTITGLDATGTSAPGTDYTDDFTVAPTTSTVLASGEGCALSGTAGSYTLTVSRADAGTRTCTITATADSIDSTSTATITFGNAPTIIGLDATGTSAPGTDYTDDFTVAPTTSTVLASGEGCALSGTAGSYTLTVSRANAGTRTCSVAAVDTLSTTATAIITFANPPTITGLDATGTSAPGTDYTDDFTVTPTTSTVLVSGAGCVLSGTAGSYTLTVSRADAGTRTCSVAAVDTLSTIATAIITFANPPTITGLDAAGSSAPGTDYTDSFTVAPATSTVLVSGEGCVLSGTAGSYTLTVSRADSGTRTCNVAAADTLSTTADVTITFNTAPTITSLEATGTSIAGINYNDTFTVTPSSTAVSASGTGCILSGTAGVYTLTVSRADAGTRTCNVNAGNASASANVTFTAATPGQTPGVPMWTWVSCSANAKLVTVGWEAGSRATGYEAQEDGGDLATWSGSATTFTRAPTPGEYYQWRVRSIGTGGAASAWTGWSGGGCAVPAPSGLSVVCQANGKVAVSWDVAAGASQYTATITSTPPPAPAAVSLKSTRNLVRSSPNSEPPNSFEMDATVGWTYSVKVKAQVNNKWSPDSSSVDATCEAVVPPAPTGVTASCSSGTLTVTWDSAGAGLAKATSYKPRIFTGVPPTESTKWTGNTAGHDMTTATIPASGEDDLPTTGTFQVKVKATNTAGDSAYSDPVEAGCGLNPVSELNAVCRDDGKVRVAWKVAEWYRQSPASRQFAIEVDGAHVRDEAASGLAEQSYDWDGAEVDRRHKVRVQARTLGTHTPEKYPWTDLVVANKCPRFVPQNVTASCSSQGVVKANWDSVNGASFYRVDWRPQHEVGSDEIRITTAVDPSWQEDEGGTYQLAVSAYAVAVSMWSDYSDPVIVVCEEVALPGAWLSPNSNEDLMLDPNSVILYTELVTRFCPTTASGAKIERICTENWNEVIEVRVDNQSWWQKLPLAQWSDGYSIAQNLKDLGGLISALRGGRLPDGTYTTRAKYSVTKAGFKQGQGYAEAKVDGFDYLTLSAHPPQVNPPVAGQPPVTGCLEPGYEYRTRTLDPITKTDGNHTTRRDVTIHYCVKP